MPHTATHISDKIVTRAELAQLVQTLKRQQKIIVSTNGSFDLLHIGHVTMLQEAKSLGDVLLVGLNSDASVQRYKGKYRPICPQDHRAGMLAALECTDYITLFDEDTPVELLGIIRPDIHVNSPEHGKDCVEREIVERHGGRIHLAQLIEGMSTSQLIQRIVEVSSHTPCRGIFIRPHELFDVEMSMLLDVFRRVHALGFHLFFISTDTGENIQERDFVETLRQEGLEIKTVSSMQHAVNAYDVILAKSALISSSMADIRMGREYNTKTVWLRKSSKTTELKGGMAGPHFTVRDLSEIPAILENV